MQAIGGPCIGNRAKPHGFTSPIGNPPTSHSSSAAGYVINPSIGPAHKPGPAIHLPGYASKYTLPVAHQQSKSMGYTAAHATYPIVRNECIREAYATYNGEVVVVEARLIVKLPGKVRADLVHVREKRSNSGWNAEINTRTFLKRWITYPFILELLI